MRLAACCAIVFAALPGCRAERYYGPFALEVPGAAREHTVWRTFRLPIDDAARARDERRARCEQEEPTRAVPCVCDYPTLRVNSYAVRVDYRLLHRRGATTYATVWLGREVEPPLPDQLPDAPQVEVLGEHLHRLEALDDTTDSFQESEVADAGLGFSFEEYPDCPGSSVYRPGPTGFWIGLSLPAEDDAELSLDFSVRVRENR